MTDSKRAPASNSRVLATDLDGTLIPLDGCTQNVSDLVTLAEQILAHGVKLVFVTGRHFASVRGVMDMHQLPNPDWIIGDVGTTIYHRQGPDEFTPLHAYHEHLATITSGVSIAELQSWLAGVAGLRRQEPEKQGAFKLSYYASADKLVELNAEIDTLLAKRAAPYSVIHSVDPFNGDGLIDFLPRGVSKAYALHWWSHHLGISKEDIVYAGDSGNDLAAFTAGYRTIVVGNADRSVIDQVRAAHQRTDWPDRLFVAPEHATSGVLAGCRTFGLLDNAARR
ncbi:MAG: HAD-IIB family hydrolase [Pirellulaceae bacterium]